ncbi:MAG: geranylgeranyl pyrophosphate synthase [Candidatus Parcubacteria bacterium]|nr:MAG: geranylgeranyl pyrophosphate synthase [Candidatus Parcubacteria bacterium]
MNINKFKKNFDKKFIKFLNQKLKKDFVFIKNLDLKLYFDHIISLAKEGKRLRPFIFYLILKSLNKKIDQNGFKIMIALELIHLFALIQDDVMDKAKTRREILTLNEFIFQNSKLYNPKNKRDYSNNVSILLSDIIFNIFYNHISNLPPQIKNEFYIMINEVLVGQFLDLYLANEPKLNSNINDIKNKNLLKTASYTFVRPMTIASIFCNLNKKEIEKIKKIGFLIGNIFQIQDDLFDYYLSKQDKDRFNDIKEGQKTYITYYLLNKTKYGAIMKKLFYKKLNYQEKKFLNELIFKNKVDKYIQNEINLNHKKAKILINQIKNKKLKNNLDYLLNLIHQRQQ